MPTKTTAAVSRDEARDFYLRVFDEFAVEVYDRGNKARGEQIIDNRQLEPVVAAINARLDGTERVGGQTIVRSNINGEYDVWQCWITYDDISHEQAEALFDEAWPTSETEVEAPQPTGAGCLCGCRLPTNKGRAFRIGHDARFAGQLIRRARAGEISGEAAVNEAAKVSPALAAKVQAGVLRKITNGQVKRAQGVPRYREGTVKVGRWSYPSRQYESGQVDRNTKRDGSGDWVTVARGA